MVFYVTNDDTQKNEVNKYYKKATEHAKWMPKHMIFVH